MSITLTFGLTTVELPEALCWTDEFSWSSVEQATERSITGGLVIDVATRTGGRPITLGRDPNGADCGWITRATLLQLRAWSNVPGLQMSLNLHGVARTVLWAHQAGAVIDAVPVAHYTDTDPDDYYRATLRFMET